MGSSTAPGPFPEGFRTGAWAGEPAFVLAGGPSIYRHERIHRLQGRGRIIAINRSLELPLNPDVWLFLDKAVWLWAMTQRVPKLRALTVAIERYKGPKVTRWVDRETEHYVGTDVYRVPIGTGGGLNPRLEEANPSSNTGYWGLGWAYALGADPIILFGVDCTPTEHKASDKREGEQQWWHDGYPKLPGAGVVYSSYMKSFNAGGTQAKQEGRRIFNCSPGSAVDEIPILLTIEEALDVAAGCPA